MGGIRPLSYNKWGAHGADKQNFLAFKNKQQSSLKKHEQNNSVWKILQVIIGITVWQQCRHVETNTSIKKKTCWKKKKNTVLSCSISNDILE